MDGNWNQRNNRSDDSQWDRWNSNASNSSYYNQPVHKPYGQGFSFASFILGVLSVTIGCCGISLPLGALGILFALLVYRKGKKLNNTAKSGLVLSCIGAVLGVLIIIYSLLTLPSLMNQLREEIDQAQSSSMPDAYTDFLNRYYDYLSNYYGIPVEE